MPVFHPIAYLSLLASLLLPPCVWAQSWGSGRTGGPVAPTGSPPRVYALEELTPEIVEKSLSPDPLEGTKGYQPNGRWVNIAQEDIDNCFLREGALPKQGGASKSAPGQQYWGTDKVLPIHIQYDNNQHTLSDIGAKKLKLIADFMKRSDLAARHWIIEGHANADGAKEEAQKAVSCRRAAFVREQLRVRYGVASDKVHAVGYGTSQKFDDPSISAADGRNRRIQVRLMAAK